MANLSSYSNYVKQRTLYKPAMMEFDGSTGYYSKTNVAPTGNKVTCVMRVRIDSFTGDVRYHLVDDSSNDRVVMYVVSSNHSTLTNRQGKLVAYTRNSSSTVIGLLISNITIIDGTERTVMYSFDGDNGTAQLIIDGSNADDTGNADRTAPTTGTLGTTSNTVVVGARSTPDEYTNGEIGFFGYDDQYLTNWSDFMDSSGNPIKQDETTWANSGWGSQPLFWNEHSEMDNNKGSAGNMTRNGTIVVAPAEEFLNG